MEKFDQKKFDQKKFKKNFREFFFQFFFAIMVPRPIWSMPAMYGGARPDSLGGEEIENGQTVHKGLAKLLYS
jgi:hypothetical protein